MFNMHHLRIFHTVALCESYSRAADRLGVTQPAVSMQVAKLEEAVGVPLVVQRGRQVGLTEAGHVLAGYAARLFRIAEEAESALADFKELRRGRLLVGASTTPGAYLLPAVIAGFQALYPEVAVSLRIGNSRTILQALHDGTLDLAVVGDLPDEGSGLTLEPLCEDRLVVVVAPGHPWAAPESQAIDLATLAATPLILREEGSSTRDVLTGQLAKAGLKPQVIMELGATDAVREAVTAGLGPAVLSVWAVRRELQEGRLAPVQVAGLDLGRSFHLACASGGSPSAAALAFTRHLRAADLAVAPT